MGYKFYRSEKKNSYLNQNVFDLIKAIKLPSGEIDIVHYKSLDIVKRRN